jgi:hypothetical protein
MALFSAISTEISDELNDTGVVYFNTTDITAAMQDAYNLVASITQCIVKKTTLSFQNNLTYYDFTDNTNYSAIYVSDFLVPLAIFSNLTNLWLLDDKTLRDFSRDRVDWENWTGAAVWWAPCNDGRKLAFVPKLRTASGTFDLYYAATAPTIVLSNSPLFPSDFHALIKFWSMFSLLADAQEYSKAQLFWDEFWGTSDGDQDYNKGVFALQSRVKNIAKADLMMLA